MTDIEKIAEILLLGFVFFTIGFYLQKFIANKEKKQYENSYKEIIENFLALNVSHLHDAANLFNLVKSNSEEKNIQNFATGSAYHFRSLFNSLKKSILQFRNYSTEDLKNDNFYKMIEKEDVDLKDLLNIELFQLGNFSRIEVTDNIQSQYAMTFANFELLSKVFLNLVENALKYSNEKIKISISDENNLYKVRIMSFGKSISEEISLKINNKIYDDIGGHGLSSLVDIMNYHDANIHITSLPNEGSCINLEFLKVADCKKDIPTITKQKSFHFKTPILLTSCFCIFFSFYVITRNPKSKVNNDWIISSSLSNAKKEKITVIAEKPKLASEQWVASQPKAASNDKAENKLDNIIDRETEKLGLDLENF
jgi:signal transduction histidine kinase